MNMLSRVFIYLIKGSCAFCYHHEDQSPQIRRLGAVQDEKREEHIVRGWWVCSFPRLVTPACQTRQARLWSRLPVAGMTRSREVYLDFDTALCGARADINAGMYLSLSSSGPVQWNHNQESSLLQDVSPFSPAYDGRSTVTLNERMRELYLQFLWLPEVRVPLPSFAPFFFLVSIPARTTRNFVQPTDRPWLVRYAIESIREHGSAAAREAFGDNPHAG